MSEKKPVYLDYNAGAPLHPCVMKALQRFFSEAGEETGTAFSFPHLPNPSSIHFHGRKAKQMLAEARSLVARSFGGRVRPEQILFTSSGTEANQQAIRSALEPVFEAKGVPHWITTSVEHHSVRVMESWVREKGGRVSQLPVDGEGLVRLDEAERILREGADLLSVVWVNNETGVVQPVERLIALARSRGVSVHLDAAQAWGKLGFDLDELAPDWAAFAAQKIGAPAGTGVLFSRAPAATRPVLVGSQEMSRRGGTENLLGIHLTGVAAANLDLSGGALDRQRELRDRLESEILRRIPGALLNGAEAPRVANTTSVSFAGAESAALVMALDLAGFSVSSGSACASGSLRPSHVLLAMGRSPTEALASVRVSFGEPMDWDTLREFVGALETAVGRARGESVVETAR